MKLTEEQMSQIANEFETDTFEHEDSPIFTGSHYQLVNSDNQSVTVVYDTKDVLEAENMAQRLGCSTSQLYREALKRYLQTA